MIKNNKHFIYFLLATFVLGNFHLFQLMTETYLLTNLLFLAWLFIFFLLTHVIFISLLNVIVPIRILFVLVVTLSLIFNFYLIKFGTVFDTGMWRNIFQTNMNEATDLFGLSSILLMISFILIPMIWMKKFNFFPHQAYKHVLTSRFFFIAASILILLLGSWPQSKSMADFLREHKQVRYLNNPSYGLFNLLKFASEELFINKTFRPGNYFAEINEGVRAEHKEELIVLVVGETARYDHFGINGYPRDTTPYLSKVKNLISYSNFTACGTSTAVSVPCMFSLKNSKEFKVTSSQYEANVLDIMPVEDVNIHWFDNNSDSKHVADRVDYQNFKTPDNNPICDVECRDVGMIPQIKKVINPKLDNLIILHQMGSHGPAYYKRYPKSFEKFQPACQSEDFSKCSQQEIINAYDNSILYTDYFLGELIKELETLTAAYEVTLLYVSDHGESLGEAGVFLHGLPKAIAPEAQTHVPVFLWAPEGSSDVSYEETLALKDNPYTHSDISDTLLRLTEVQTNAYKGSGSSMIILGD